MGCGGVHNGWQATVLGPVDMRGDCVLEEHGDYRSGRNCIDLVFVLRS